MKLTEQEYKRFWSKVDRSDYENCWPWTAYQDPHTGRGAFRLRGKIRTAYRVSFAQYYDEPLDEPDPCMSNGQSMTVCHTCDNPACVNPAHLFLGTNRDNMKDRRRKDRYELGSQKANAKLTERKVQYLLDNYIPVENRYSQSRLAREYGVARGTILRVLDGHPSDKLTEQQEAEIRAKHTPYHHPTTSYRRMAKQLGVSRGPVGNILSGNTWKHVRRK